MFLWVQGRAVVLFKRENSRKIGWLVSSQTLSGRQGGSPQIYSRGDTGLCDVLFQIAKDFAISTGKFDG